MSKKERIRAAASNKNRIGKERHQLYRAAYARIKDCIESEHYLEAIGIIESLISDRLESRLTFLLNKDFGFKTLGTLINKIKTVEKDGEIKALVIKELDSWREQRNRALHEMVKIDGSETPLSWDERCSVNRAAAISGNRILRTLDRREQALRRANR